MNLNKIINPIKKQTAGGRWYNVYCKIKIKDGALSIVGVEGPLANGNSLGGIGQIDMSLKSGDRYNEGWDSALVTKFLKVWKRWHLNDMRAECEHQRERGETWKTHPSAECPDCGHKLGHAWLFEALPSDVIEFLKSLPESKNPKVWSWWVD